MQSDGWTTLTNFDIAALKAQQFSAPEVCYLTGISAERLHQWHWLGLVPEPRAVSGRGHRRKYGFLQVAYLTALRILSKRGVPLNEAALLTERLLALQIQDAFDAVCVATSIEAAERVYPTTVAIYDLGEEEGQETYRFEAFFQGKLIAGVAVDGPDIESWMHRDSRSNAILVAPAELAIGLRFGIEEVLCGRGTDSFGKVLREHQAKFKRQGKPAAKRPRPPAPQAKRRIR